MNVYVLGLCVGLAGMSRAQTSLAPQRVANPAFASLAYRPTGIQADAPGEPGGLIVSKPGDVEQGKSWLTSRVPRRGTDRDRPANQVQDMDEQRFVFGIYLGINNTRFAGDESNTGGDLSGRLGYQAGFFARSGGRLYGQIGAEFFVSSSNYYIASYGQPVASVQDRITIQYLQLPAYIGYKLVKSDRGVSAVRLQAGIEYANRVNASSGKFLLTNAETRGGTLNGLGQLGFDLGPLLVDLTYHYGFGTAISTTKSVGFAGAQRRILSVSIGVKL